MARSTKGLYKRGNVWWITYFDATGRQRFESSKSSNKRDAEKRLVDRRKEAQEGCCPRHPSSRCPWRIYESGISTFVGHQRGVATKQITSPTSCGYGGIP